jgi:hypothetical protein
MRHDVRPVATGLVCENERLRLLADVYKQPVSFVRSGSAHEHLNSVPAVPVRVRVRRNRPG